MKICLVRQIALGVVLLGTAVGSAGLSLGRVQGVAWIGKPLDVAILTQIDQSDDLEPGCFQADVFYGDAQIDPARVTTRLLQPTKVGKPGLSVQVRVAVLVNEPIVSIELIAGCQQKTSRRYSLFADLATSVVQPAMPSVASVKRVEAAVIAQGMASASLGNAAKRPNVGASARKQVAKRSPASVSVGQTQAARTANTVRQSAKARLRLDPLEFIGDVSPVLRSSDTLLTIPQEDAQKRGEAAALWQAFNASPQTLALEDARMQRLHESVQSLRTVTTENEKNLAEVAEKAQQVESERYANVLVYSLIGLWVAGMLVLIWIWRHLRARRASNWADGFEGGDSLLAELAQVHKTQRAAFRATAMGATSGVSDDAYAAAAPVVDVDFDLGQFESAENALMPVGAIYSPPGVTSSSVSVASILAKPAASLVGSRGPGQTDFSHSMASVARAIDSEELVDARQKADFFVSIGQIDQAIEILTNRIAQVGESSPLVCLDLLKIYHAQDMRNEFEFMRAEFNHWFAGRVPEFALFASHGRALERYPHIMQKIVALWPKPDVLEYIEACIYQNSEDGEGIVFDLQAYLDLLMLHGVAKRIVRQGSGPQEGGGALEMVRIPQRAPVATDRYGSDDTPVGGSIHRAGAHMRGSQQRSAVEVPDPELEVDTQGAPLTPPGPPRSAEVPSKSTKPAGQISKDDSGTTDFDFFGLR